eukprot:TRINITY_DN13660_c0_g2_i1.p1 TRINITY_DN13660_c0_g2~~TRINITY_DN13660_c0_g2_i1.p1  ORF type:complete len:232 (-),score=41.75 TRINITY_DN13660_c0_g2_i1:105-800(-)
MAMRSAMSRFAAPLLRSPATTAFRQCQPQLQKQLLLPRTSGLTTIRSAWKPEPQLMASALQVRPREEPPKVVGGLRAMSTWRLRPYAAAGTSAASLSALSAGHSKVGLSLLVMPHKALPMALALAPTVWVLPAMYRMIFQNSMRHTTASVFTVILYLVLSFTPVPCFENLFSELTFYGIALVSTFFMYTFFPEVLLHDFMFMHYLALFTIPLIPLAFAYMPMFAARSYLFL